MTDTPSLPRRTVTLASSSGKPLLKVPLLPAAAAAAVALALAPRLTALAAVGALLRRLSLTLNGAPADDTAA
jgi:hypothetical protein